MKCVVIEKPGKVVYTEREPGVLPRDFARIKVMAAAICATDLEVIDGNIPANYPLTPGHEWSGIVESVADEIPKSFIVYTVGDELRICFSPLSTSALVGRMDSQK